MGTKMAAKIDQKSIKIDAKKIHFFNQLKTAIRHGIGSQDGRKIGSKTMRKRVGNDLAVNLKKSEKMTPL